jgi:ABC-2 type transport system permease protein
MTKVKTIVKKEWAEVFKNRLVLFSVAFLPLLLLAIPFITLAITNNFAEGDIGSADQIPVGFEFCQGLNDADCMQVYMLDIFTLMFMILPVSIPVTIAAYSIVGEKSSHSLEPLLATPITTTELLVGKIISATIPAVAATWIAFGIYLAGVWIMVNEVVFDRFLDPLWLVAIFVVGPLLTLLAVCTAIIVSSRVTDPRVAEQLSAVVVLPLILIIVGQSMGLLIIDRQLVLLAALFVLIVDAILLYLSIKLFQREQILTRWK